MEDSQKHTSELQRLLDQVKVLCNKNPSDIYGNENMQTLKPPIWKKYSSYIIYISIPISIFILFIILKPMAMIIEYKDGTKAINWSKMVLWTLIVSIPLVTAVYIYINKHKKEKIF